MDDDNFHSNLRSLQELILDEQKLITYISLSKELCIHVNDSKSLMKKLVEDMKNKRPEILLNVNYVISGTLNNNTIRTTVCMEADIDKLRTTFNTVLFEHIYSVSQGSPSVDNVAFVAVNRFEDLPLCTGLIKSISCAKRSVDELNSLKSESWNNRGPVLDQVSNISRKKEVKEITENSCKNTKSVAKTTETKSEPIIKTEIPSPKKNLQNGIKTQNKKSVTKTKSVAGFFTKTNNSSSIKTTQIKEIVEEPIEKSEDIVDVKVEKMELDKCVQEDSTKNRNVQNNTIKNVKTNKLKNKHKDSSLEDIKKKSKVDKKRKRVLHVSDSESETEKDDPFKDEIEPTNYESEDEIPPTPSANAIKITSGINNPKKRRKIVDKTYTDEDGYILTKKEEIYESCSDNEDEIQVKENVHINPIKTEISPKEVKNKKSKKKVSPPQKGKQTTLMNFFQKK